MRTIIIRTALFGLIGLLSLGGPAAQENRAEGPHATGLIPLDPGQIEEIVANWPRITRVGLNPLGFDRVNEVRTGKGKAPLDPLSVAPIGGEVESSLPGRSVEVLGAAANEALAGDLPVSVDNSQLRFFPPIRNQGSLGSCASFASTYVQLSYMTAFQRNLDIRDPANNTNKYSPKWSYNMLNDGSNSGSSLYQNYALLQRHGAATWAEFPYDTNYLSWCLDPAVWRNALGVRTKVTQFVHDVSTDAGMELVKALLTDGYVLVYGTYISSWVFMPAKDDASTSADDAAVGRSVAYWMNGSEGSHAMSIVGYNDAVWTDINSNGVIDPGEKGAFRIANTWGTGWYEGGFTWLAYDALRTASAVSGGPSTGRLPAFQGDMIYVLTARNGYTPLAVGEFTLSHVKRNQLRLTLGCSSTSTTLPTTTWTPSAIQAQGGAFAFDGSTTAVNGTFVLDFTDILVQGAGPRRYYLGVNDTASGDAATLSAFKIVDTTTEPDTENASSLVPLTADAQQVYAYVDYTYPGPAYNDPPQLTSPQVSPVSGTAGATFTFNVRYTDQDGDVPTVKNLVLDGTSRAMSLLSGQPADGWYTASAVLVAGPHSYAFYFEDGRGESAKAPLAGATSGPAVYGHMLSTLMPSNAATGDPAFVLTVNGSDLANGAVVTWDGADRPTTFVSSSRVDAAIPAGDLTVGKSVPVVVRSAAGILSNVLTFTVNNPRPSLTSVSPASASGGGSEFTLTLRGSGFVSNSKARWNGLDLTTTYFSPTEVRATLTSQELGQAGEFEVSVSNPSPGGGSTAGIAFSVSDFTVSVSPTEASVAAGRSASFSLDVTPGHGSFDSAVTFTCTGLPGKCTASFSPANVTPGGTTAKVTLTLITKAPQSSAGATAFGPTRPVPPAAGLLLLAAIVAALAFVRQKAVRWPGRRRAAAAAALILLTFWVAGCGAGGKVDTPDPGTPAGTYHVGIQATSGSLTVQSSVTLVVN
jgi:C1A family cysteine protease